MERPARVLGERQDEGAPDDAEGGTPVAPRDLVGVVAHRVGVEVHHSVSSGGRRTRGGGSRDSVHIRDQRKSLTEFPEGWG